MHRITYITSSLRKCGPTIQLYNLVKYIPLDKYSPIILTLSPEPADTMIKEFRKLNIEIDSLNLTRIEGIVKGKTRLFDYLFRLKPDLLHTYGIRPDKLINSLELKCPVVSTIRNYPHEDYVKRYGIIKGRIVARSHLNLIKKAKNAVACSKELANKFNYEKGVDLEYIQNGVDKDVYKVVPQDKKNELREDLGYSVSAKVFVVIGTLIPRKNVATIIKAFNHLPKSDCVNLTILGAGPETEMINKLAVENDKIIFVGQVDNVLQYLQCADFYISASLSEGLPNSVMEAMSCGLPVVLSDIGSHKELFSSKKDYSYFFKANDIMQLKEKIAEILNDDYGKISMQMREIIEADFTAEKMSKKYQNYYSRLIEASLKRVKLL